jgi:hypothetical protein
MAMFVPFGPEPDLIYNIELNLTLLGPGVAKVKIMAK